MTFRILNHYIVMPKLQKCGIEYILSICRADGGGGGSFVVEVDYFKVSWPRPIHNENKHACNGKRECF